MHPNNPLFSLDEVRRRSRTSGLGDIAEHANLERFAPLVTGFDLLAIAIEVGDTGNNSLAWRILSIAQTWVVRVDEDARTFNSLYMATATHLTAWRVAAP